MTLLVLVRHAETDGNAAGRSQGRREVPLNAHGRLQATALAAALRIRPVAAVVSSTAGRAYETAQVIAAAHGLEVNVDPRLAELDQGALDGLTGEEMRDRHPEFLARWRDGDPSDLRMPGGETMREAQSRMIAAVEAITRSHPGAEVVVISHNLAIKALLCHLLGVPLAAFRRLQIELASVSLVEQRADGAWVVLGLNEHCHEPPA